MRMVQPLWHLLLHEKHVWPQQDGATYQTSRAAIDLLHQTFDGRLISRYDEVRKQVRRLYLDPLLCGPVKEMC